MRGLWISRGPATLSGMDVQETIDSLRRVLESVIAPGVESLRLRLDALERDLQGNGQGIDRLDARIDRLTGRMEEGFSRLDVRIDTLGISIHARVDHLTRPARGGASENARIDASALGDDALYSRSARQLGPMTVWFERLQSSAR